MNIRQEIEIARQIALEAHEGQTRRGGRPYMTHVQAVADAVSERARPTAYIHDVMEDHPDRFTPEILKRRGLSEETVSAAILLNKNEHSDVDYETYVLIICQNTLAKEVKLADIRHNLSDNPSEKQVLKYTAALKILQEI